MPLKKIKNSSGQVLAGVVMVMMVLLIIVPAVVTWVQMESRASVKDQKSSLAFNLAEAAVDRGMWKLKSTTSTWANAQAGTALAGYNFDATYTDVPGGSYRVTFSTAANGRVQVWGEGRDSNRKETRSIQAVFANASLPGPVLAQGVMNYGGVFQTHWGPVMAQNNINITGTAAQVLRRFPRKLSKQVVLGNATLQRDTNGLTAPNTDNQEWWSNYSVPKLPLLDFATLRASATATGTLNYYNGHTTSHTLTGYTLWNPASTNLTNIHYLNATNKKCTSTVGGNHFRHFYDSFHHPNANQNLVWYWDNDVTFTGYGYAYGAANCHSMGLYGTVIVRGNMTIDASDCYGGYLGNIPTNAWLEYVVNDTAASAQYPGDNGLRSAWNVFNFGVNNWSGQTGGALTDVGFRGLMYIGGNLNMTTNSSTEIHGIVWVVGNVLAASTIDTHIYFDGDLEVPVLNVILTRESWMEVSPNTTAWP